MTENKTQELIERISGRIKTLEGAGFRDECLYLLRDCKDQLTAQADEIKRLREGLEKISKAEIITIDGIIDYDAALAINDIAKQLLNNEGV